MKKIAFILTKFPEKTKTFELNQILNAYNAGYDIRIFPHYMKDIEESGQREITERYGFMDKIIKPTPFELNKLKRVVWILNTLYRGPRKLIPYFIKSFNPLLFGKSAINFMVCYKVVQFYGNSDFAIFHCQFGPNGLIAAWLKELGLINGKIITTFHGYDAHIKEDT